MGFAGNEEKNSAISASSLLPPVGTCVSGDAIISNSSAPVNTTTLCQNSMELDRTAFLPAAKTFAVQLGCSPPLGSPEALSKLCDGHAQVHVASLCSLTMVGSSLPGDAAVRTSRWSSSDNAAQTTLPPPIPTVVMAPSSRRRFMQSFVSTLLPELKRIHSRSSSTSLEDKFSAVRVAADMSLVISGRANNSWRRALLEELESTCRSKIGVRVTNGRNRHALRGRICDSTGGKRAFIGGSLALHMQARRLAKNSDDPKSHTILGISKEHSSAGRRSSAKRSHARGSVIGFSDGIPGITSRSTHCRKGPHVSRTRRATFKRRGGFLSYVKALRNSRSAMKVCGSVRSLTNPGDVATKTHESSISKEQITSLSGLVPGGRNMDVPLLFQEAADYILSLQMQVEALQSLCHSVML